jgi:hypothetical protein
MGPQKGGSSGQVSFGLRHQPIGFGLNPPLQRPRQQPINGNRYSFGAVWNGSQGLPGSDTERGPAGLQCVVEVPQPGDLPIEGLQGRLIDLRRTEQRSAAALGVTEPQGGFVVEPLDGLVAQGQQFVGILRVRQGDAGAGRAGGVLGCWRGGSGLGGCGGGWGRGWGRGLRAGHGKRALVVVGFGWACCALYL